MYSMCMYMYVVGYRECRLGNSIYAHYHSGSCGETSIPTPKNYRLWVDGRGRSNRPVVVKLAPHSCVRVCLWVERKGAKESFLITIYYVIYEHRPYCI